MKTPLELLKSELAKYKKALYKSEVLYSNDEITNADHIKHRLNLTPIIQQYEMAITILENNQL